MDTDDFFFFLASDYESIQFKDIVFFGGFFEQISEHVALIGHASLASKHMFLCAFVLKRRT